MADPGQPLIQIEDLTKVFYTDEIETHALSGVGFDLIGVEDLGQVFDLN